MIDKKIYTCLVCLQGSHDPKKCTNCGSIIEPINIENIYISPPRHGKYVIPSKLINSDAAISSAEEVRSKYFHHFELTITPIGTSIVSNERAYEKLVEAIAHRCRLPIAKITDAAPFTAFE